MRVKVVKNKVAPPFKQAEFDIIYGSGICWEGTVLDTALERKVVQKSGSYFCFEDERLGQGRQNATAFLREHPDVGQQSSPRIQALAGTGPSRLRPVAARARAAGEGRAARPRTTAEARGPGAREGRAARQRIASKA